MSRKKAIEHVRIEKGSFRFSGDCPSCWSVCHAVCCRTAVVPLADEEIRGGRFRTMKHKGATVLERTDEGCVYLKGNRCSIYQDRPAACRAFDCSKHLWRMLPLDMKRADAQLPAKAPLLKVDGKTYHYSTFKRGK